jgi:hypothetical protein
MHPLIVTLALLGCFPKAKPVTQHPPWNSKAAPSTRPSATRHGQTIRLRPHPATFRVPRDWVKWHRQFGNNFHLTHKQLDAVARGAGDWDTEYASVCNAVLPFDRCAAHVGDEGWGQQGVSCGDLQVRLYDLADSPQVVDRRIHQQGVADIQRFSGHRPQVKREGKSRWRRTVLSYGRWYGDYGGTAHVDFRVRRLRVRTFVFVFMYADYQSNKAAITSILKSFHWTGGR